MDPNPYSADANSDAPGVKTRWRLVPAAMSIAIGLASFAFGLFAVAMMIGAVLSQDASDRIPKNMMIGMAFACASYIGFGSTWMTAGWLYWQRRYRGGLTATAIGVLIPAVSIAILVVFDLT